MRYLEDDGASPCFGAVEQQQRQRVRSPGPPAPCEHAARRVVRYDTTGVTVIAMLSGQAANSPNDVARIPTAAWWFTDPPFGGSLYEGMVDAPGGPSNPQGLLNAKAGQPGWAGLTQARADSNIYRADPSGVSTW